jgi:hypothetical protein
VAEAHQKSPLKRARLILAACGPRRERLGYGKWVLQQPLEKASMDLKRETELSLTRRQLFGLASSGIGVAALASLLKPTVFADTQSGRDPKTGGLAGLPHFAPKTCSTTSPNSNAIMLRSFPTRFEWASE